MTEQNRQQALSEAISALADNQTSELELKRILKACEQDPSVKATWARYHIIGTALRSEPIALPLPSFVTGISAAIAAEHEQGDLDKTRKSTQGIWYQLGRVALVASVAGGMILGVQQYNDTLPNGAIQVAADNSIMQVPVSPAPSWPSGINSPVLNTRTVSAQSGYPQNNHRVLFQSHRGASGTLTDEDLANYFNQIIQAQSNTVPAGLENAPVPFNRVIITEKK
jgi:sigma-E factor negative regulatory protein RseA